MLSVTFATLWILPFYLLSKVVNSIWFADIADSAFRKTANGRPRMMNSFSVSIADTVFTIVVESGVCSSCTTVPFNFLGASNVVSSGVYFPPPFYIN